MDKIARGLLPFLLVAGCPSPRNPSLDLDSPADLLPADFAPPPTDQLRPTPDLPRSMAPDLFTPDLLAPIVSAPPDLACVPDCAGRLCGPDPVCGTSCGICTMGTSCGGDGQCAPCTPKTCSAAGAQCGATVYDGCVYLNCGNCPGVQGCSVDNQCVGLASCTPAVVFRGSCNYVATANNATVPLFCVEHSDNDSDGGPVSASCAALGGTWSASSCSHVGSTGGCESLDVVTTRACVLTTKWNYDTATMCSAGETLVLP